MTSKEETLKEFERSLELEIESRELYDGYLKKIKNKEILEGLLRIRDDEVKHINLLKKAIEAMV